MRKYIKIYTLLASLLFIWSCDDAINVDPADEIVESNSITNVTEAGQAVIGVYATLSMTSAIYWNSLFTDEVRVGENNNGQGLQTHTWSITSGNGEAAGIYAGYSLSINRANKVLDAIEGLTPQNDEETALLARYKGEMLAIRAWAHFTMATYFTPSFTDMSALSIPYVDYVVVLQKPNRNTWGEVLAGINSDLDEAETLIPASANQNIFMTLDAVTALRARMALYTENYDAAIGYATELINTYSLPSINEFPLIWTDTSEEGVIFKLARVTGDDAIGQIYNPSPSSTYFSASEKILNMFTTDDVRSDVYFDGTKISKYPGIVGIIGLNDIKVFRIAEQYLIRAEANLRKASPNVQAAEDDYNTLRTNRIVGYTPETFTTVNVAIGQIMEERMRELAFEGHRFLDLKRTNQPVDRNSADCNDLAADACFLEASSYLWALPIPQAELFVNTNMTQNPGYN